MGAAIELKQLTKTYGIHRGVENISMMVEEGSIFGFLGPNGAGKTTTISMLVDLIRPTSGSVKIFGLDARRDGVEIRRRMGFLAGDFALDEDLTGWQQLEYFGNLRGGLNKPRVKQLAERLDCTLDSKFKTLSRGNRQKVGLISALMHDPELLVFDEPTSGLDPLIQAEFGKIIAEHQAKGGTAFISSHSLSEVQTICTHVGFIRSGELIALKRMEELTEAATKYVRVVSSDQKLLKALKELKNIKIDVHANTLVSFTVSGDINPILALLGRHKVTDVTITETDLETVFMHYYQEKTNV